MCKCGNRNAAKKQREKRMLLSVANMVHVTCSDCIAPLYGTAKEAYPVHQTTVFVRRGLAEKWKRDGNPVVIVEDNAN